MRKEVKEGEKDGKERGREGGERREKGGREREREGKGERVRESMAVELMVVVFINDVGRRRPLLQCMTQP